jgi:hypothetical protein
MSFLREIIGVVMRHCRDSSEMGVVGATSHTVSTMR